MIIGEIKRKKADTLAYYEELIYVNHKLHCSKAVKYKQTTD